MTVVCTAPLFGVFRSPHLDVIGELNVKFCQQFSIWLATALQQTIPLTEYRSSIEGGQIAVLSLNRELRLGDIVLALLAPYRERGVSGVTFNTTVS